MRTEGPWTLHLHTPIRSRRVSNEHQHATLTNSTEHTLENAYMEGVYICVTKGTGSISNFYSLYQATSSQVLELYAARTSITIIRRPNGSNMVQGYM